MKESRGKEPAASHAFFRRAIGMDCRRFFALLTALIFLGFGCLPPLPAQAQEDGADE